jgi:hypothetical protein
LENASAQRSNDWKNFAGFFQRLEKHPEIASNDWKKQIAYPMR